MLDLNAQEFGALLAAQGTTASSIGHALVKANAAEPKKAKKKAKTTVADTIRDGIRKEMAMGDILKLVHKKHKGMRTTIACVYWYKSRFNRGLEK